MQDASSNEEENQDDTSTRDQRKQNSDEMKVLQFYNEKTRNAVKSQNLTPASLWDEENHELYTTFIMMFGNKMVGENTWMRRFDELYDQYVQIPEEAFVALVLENSTRVWYRDHEKKLQEKNLISARPELCSLKLVHQDMMKGKSAGGKWTIEGQLRMNEIAEAIEQRRERQNWKGFMENLRAILLAQSVKVDALGRKRRMEYGKRGRNGNGNDIESLNQPKRQAKNFLNIVAL